MRRDSPFPTSFSGACTESATATTRGGTARPVPDLATRAPHGAAVIICAFIISASLATYSLVVTSGDGTRAAAQLVSRFAILVFAASLSAKPLARVFPTNFLRSAALEAENLRFAFLIAYAVSVACVIGPAELGGQSLSWGELLNSGFNSLVLVLLAIATWREMAGASRPREWRTIRMIGTTYFWFAFVFSDLVRLSKSSPASGWHQYSLTLLLSSAGVWVAARALSRPGRSARH